MEQATPRVSSGFTLLELMIALGIIAILALIAIPAYLNYSARATAAELLEEIDALRTRYTLATTELGAEGCVVPAHLPDPQLPKPSYAELKVDWHLSTPPLNYRPVLSVLSRSDQQGVEGVHISRAVHDVLAQNGHLITSGAVLTDNLAAFNVYLASQEVRLCAPLNHSTPSPQTPVPKPIASQPDPSGAAQPTGSQQQQPAASCPPTHVAYPDGSCARVCNDGFIYNASAHLCQRPQTAPQAGCPPTHVAYPDGSCARVCNDGWSYDSASGQCQHPSSGSSTSTTGQPAVQTAPSATTGTSTTSGQITPSSSNGQPATVTDQGQNKDHGHHYGQQKPHQNHGHHGGHN